MIEQRINEIAENFNKLSASCSKDIEYASEIMTNAIRNGGKIMFCGNGGSAADSQHLAAELIGRYKKNRKPLPGIALTTDTSTITAVANDFSFNDIFSRQVEAFGKIQDVLYATSTSGESKNIINAIQVAKNNGIKTIGITGVTEGLMNKICDVTINVPAESPDRVQEMHIAVGQIICEILENRLC